MGGAPSLFKHPGSRTVDLYSTVINRLHFQTMPSLSPFFPRSWLSAWACWVISLFAVATPAAFGASTAATLFPANGAREVCPDTPLRLTFPGATSLGTGLVRIRETESGRVVATVDLAAPVATKTIGGLDGYKYYQAIVAGREATVFLPSAALGYGRNYEVTIDAGAFRNGDEAFAGLTAAGAWHFSTKAAPPKPDATRLVVAADGSGDFCTLQGALDFIPDGNTRPTTVFLRKGTYPEIIFFTNKHSVTVLGEDRRETVIAYANNATFNPSGGNPFAGRANPSGEDPKQGGSVYRRGLFLAHRVHDFTLANLTVRNTTPQGGSQAEALILNGTADARAIIRDVDFYSFQDTVQFNGQTYVSGCRIEGDVDFMWGTGPSFFENCTVRSVRSAAYYTQVRNPATNHGFVYYRCVFDGADGVADNFLSRIEPHRFPHSEVVLVDCVVGPSVGAVGWQLQAAPKGTPAGSTENLHFWEFNSHTADSRPIEASQRLPVSRQLKRPDDAVLISDYVNPTFVLGRNWNPKPAL